MNDSLKTVNGFTNVPNVIHHSKITSFAPKDAILLSAFKECLFSEPLFRIEKSRLARTLCRIHL